ncbi:MAG: MFS transporter [Cyclobacteriaceae bacterium]|jgi:MFS family permease|nr:MFS transporter [Cyclobacteriaceae bacterium]
MDVKDRQRLFLNIAFFLSGICFSTWTSRIPTIKSLFEYNDAELGTVLLFMPIGSLAGLPLSGWLVSKFDSRQPMTAGLILLAIAMAFIGLAQSTFLLIVAVTVFSFSMRIMNISLNTQAITLQKQFDKKINGMFHGMWSTGGIAGIAISTFFVALDIPMSIHVSVISSLAILTALYSYQHLLTGDRSTSGNKLSMSKPDPYIVYLGLLAFFAAICEGGMFDWSGVYFKEVVKEDLFTLGYLIFMICMALSRFASDRMMDLFGMPRTYLISSALIILGIGLAVVFPYFWSALFGFCLIGIGTAAIIPMTFLLAGSAKKYSPGVTISLIATYSIAGMLLGPPLIGYVSHALGLRIAFVIFALAGLMLIPISQLFFRHQKLLK